MAITGPQGTPRSNTGRGLGRVIDERSRRKPVAQDFRSTGAGQYGGLGSGAPGSGGGGIPDIPSPTGPDKSPWYPHTFEIPNNSTDSFNFGHFNAVKAVTIRFYAERNGVARVGLWRVTYDDTLTPLTFTPFEWGPDIGLSAAASVVSGELILTLTATNDTHPITCRTSYTAQGVTAGWAFGVANVRRATRSGVGLWAIVNDPVNGAVGGWVNLSGDDCGTTLSASIANGTLDLVMNTDGSDASATTLSSTAMVYGVNGAAKWQSFGLSAAASGSDSQPFTSELSGELDWLNAAITIPNDDSASFTFPFQEGAVYIHYAMERGNEYELGEMTLWRDDSGAHGADGSRVIYFGDAGVSFAASVVGSSLVLTATATDDTNPVVLQLIYLTEAQI